MGRGVRGDQDEMQDIVCQNRTMMEYKMAQAIGNEIVDEDEG